MKRIFRYFSNYKKWLALAIFFNLLTVIFSLVSIATVYPFLRLLFGLDKINVTQPTSVRNVQDLIDTLNYYLGQVVLQNGREQALAWVCMGVTGIFFLKNLFRYLALYTMAPIRNGVVYDMRQAIFNQILTLPLSYYSNEKKGNLVARVSSDVQEVEWSILNVIEAIFSQPPMIIGSLIFMVGVSPALTFFVFILLLVTVFIIGGVGKTLKKQSAEAQEKMGMLLSEVEETIGGLRIIQGFNAEKYQDKKFSTLNNSFRNILTNALRRRDLSSPMTEFLGITVMAILLWYGSRRVFSGEMDGALFITYLMMFYNIINPAKALSSAIYNIRKGLGASDRIDEILNTPVLIQNDKNPIPVKKFSNEILYKNVYFSYTNENVVLNNISLTIPKGKTVAIVGSSGAGKSTLADLLPRFYDVTKGSIEIDGIDIRKYDLKDLRSIIGIVTQEAILFNDTIANNISFGLDVSKEEIIAAAKVANAHEFIMETENEYNTIIGDRGSKLSGGQRQRITIARAILRNPPILILDEATSALDSKSEKEVQYALDELMKDKTAIIIAHRLATIQNADQIVVMANGKIVEIGNHQSLLQNPNSQYQKLVNMQNFT